jgi:hypothetical protein
MRYKASYGTYHVIGFLSIYLVADQIRERFDDRAIFRAGTRFPPELRMAAGGQYR